MPAKPPGVRKARVHPVVEVPPQVVDFRIEFPPRVLELWSNVYRESRESGGNFYLFAFLTDSLAVAHTTNMLCGLAPATKRPAQCIGFVFLSNPARYFQPIGETGNMQPVLERAGTVQRYQWRIIVDLKDAERALVVALEQAAEMLARIRLRATALGACG